MVPREDFCDEADPRRDETGPSVLRSNRESVFL
jgi:hypothetical protein